MTTINERAGKALAGRWRAGMLIRYGDFTGPSYTHRFIDPAVESVRGSLWAPVMDDPATRGAYLDVVREAWGSPLASLVNERSNRWAMLFLGGPVVHGATEAETLVRALEAAPTP